MENRILLVQALDERDLLVKKIMDKTEALRLVDCRKPRAEAGWKSRLSIAELEKEGEKQLQQIRELILRYDKLCKAITLCNAGTMIETTRGQMALACAIALRSRLRGMGPYGTAGDFEGTLVKKMRMQYEEMQDALENICEPAEDQNCSQAQFYDPLRVLARASRLQEEQEELLAELETKIKVANATTYLTAS